MLDIAIGVIALAAGAWLLVKGRSPTGAADDGRARAGLILAAAPLLGALLTAFLFMISGQQFLAPISRCSIAGLIGALIFTIIRPVKKSPDKP